ncbi:hypothetical protein [Nostoc sp. UHCC 0251]|uniref:hypothetical protein n=1 Tax=Nostoc sp. UHCC 0251 TaxID=3110240 RepID=UPI002B1FBE55|nr:hypothetical protein [Nostoc sp. UHCC 0251]MEA5625725.1 hypothetical protein [Nostoc sp. UHCC 0251]
MSKPSENLIQCLFNLLKGFEEFYKPWIEELWYLRIPTFGAVLSFLSFWVIDQTVEVYRVFALNAFIEVRPPNIQDFQTFLSFVFIFALSFSIWYSASLLSNEIKRIKDQEQKGQEQKDQDKDKKKEERPQIWLPPILGALPLLAFGLGLLKATSQATDSPKELIYLWVGIAIVVVMFLIYSSVTIKIDITTNKIGITTNKIDITTHGIKEINFLSLKIIILLFSLFTLFTLPLIYENSILIWFIRVSFLVLFGNTYWKFTKPKPLLSKLFSLPPNEKFAQKIINKIKIIILLFVLPICFVSSEYFTFKPEELLPILGPVSIVAIFLSVFVIGSSSLLYWGYKLKFPIITFLIFILIASSWLDWNDNHRIRQVENFKPHKLETLETSFMKWKEARKKEISRFQNAGNKYPIYIVSAQGGGIFAAYHAASTLSRLQDLCPAFANHVFTISGVSGGSLGAAVFSSLINTELNSYSNSLPEKPCSLESLKTESNGELKRGPLEEKAHNLLNQDLLSPLLAAGLFPDFIQRFLPFSINSLDRARGLEYAFEKGWDSNSTYKNDKDGKKFNLLKGSYYDHWKADGSGHLLLS